MRRMRTLVLLLGAVLVFGASVKALIVAMEPIELRVAQRPVPSWTADLPAIERILESRPAKDYAELETRPIFSQSRKPFVFVTEVAEAPPVEEPPLEPELTPLPEIAVAAAPAPPSVDDPRQMRLVGVQSIGDTWRALISTANDVEGTWYGEPDTVGGWSISHIDANSITLATGTQQERLQLYVENSTIPLGR